jgi:uncharacterized protein (TIGR04255 family)
VRTKFKNPPINELIVGLYFASEVAALRAEHIGVFWASIRDEFPTIQQQLQITPPTALIPGITFGEATFGEFFPMPRYWLEAKNEPAYLMQIQKDAFLFNWRKRGNDYPHFAAVKAAFDKNFARYAGFLKSEFDIEPPPIGVAELTYVNLIESCEYWSSPRDTPKVIPRFSVPTGEMSTSEAAEFNQVTVERFASDLSVRTTVRSAKSTRGPCLVFELRCTGSQGNVVKSATDAWFERAHDLVGECFLKMTHPEIQNRYWQPT